MAIRRAGSLFSAQCFVQACLFFVLFTVTLMGVFRRTVPLDHFAASAVACIGGALLFGCLLVGGSYLMGVLSFGQTVSEGRRLLGFLRNEFGRHGAPSRREGQVPMADVLVIINVRQRLVLDPPASRYACYAHTERALSHAQDMEALMPRTAFAAELRNAPLVRRPTNVTLPEPLLREARELKINVSQACERGLSAEVTGTKKDRWLAENRAAMDAWNDHVEQHGLPLAEFRQF